MRFLKLLPLFMLLGVYAQAQSPTYGVGRTPTEGEIRAWDISISPTGEELPQGQGTVATLGHSDVFCRSVHLTQQLYGIISIVACLLWQKEL